MDAIDLIVKVKSFLKDDVSTVEALYCCLKQFFNIIYQNSNEETVLLNRLINYAYYMRPKLFIGKQLIMKSGVFVTHQKHIGFIARREFGDIMFVTLLNNGKSSRVGYANAYQIKVGYSFKDILSNMDYNQYRFYNYQLLPTILRRSTNISSVPAIMGDFLYYWLVFNGKVAEIPLSALTIENESRYYRSFINSYALTWTTLVNNIFLVSGISVNEILPLAKPSLRNLLEGLLKKGVEASSQYEIFYDGGKKDEGGEWTKIEFPIDGRIVIATEIIIEE